MPPLGKEDVVKRVESKIERNFEQENRIHEAEAQISALMTSIIPPAEKRRFRTAKQEAWSAKAHYSISEDDVFHQAAWLERDADGNVMLFTEVYEQFHPQHAERYYRISSPKLRVSCRSDGRVLSLEESRTSPRQLPYSNEYEAVVNDIRDTLLLVHQAQTARNIGAVGANEYFEAWMFSEI